MKSKDIEDYIGIKIEKVRRRLKKLKKKGMIKLRDEKKVEII